VLALASHEAINFKGRKLADKLRQALQQLQALGRLKAAWELAMQVKSKDVWLGYYTIPYHTTWQHLIICSDNKMLMVTHVVWHERQWNNLIWSWPFVSIANYEILQWSWHYKILFILVIPTSLSVGAKTHYLTSFHCVVMVMVVRVEDRHLLSGQIHLLFGEYDKAERLFVNSSVPITALQMRRDLLHWCVSYTLLLWHLLLGSHYNHIV
jgi:hypothetical protein